VRSDDVGRDLWASVTDPLSVTSERRPRAAAAHRSSFPERHRIDWVDDVQLEAASSKHGPTAATALGL